MCITIRKCVAYIPDPNTTLTFDLKVKFTGFLTCFRVWPITIFWFDIGLPYLAHVSVTMRRCIAYIPDPDTTLTFDLKVKFIGFMTWLFVQASPFLSSGIVILCYSVGVSPWFNVSHTVMNSVWPWPVTSISKVYFHNEFESGKMSLLFNIGTPNFCIWQYHHETLCVHSRP